MLNTLRKCRVFIKMLDRLDVLNAYKSTFVLI